MSTVGVEKPAPSLALVSLTDVTLRDGLQMEARVFSLDEKLGLYQRLKACGYSRLEVTSFVHPKWIPQFSDSEAFCQRALANEPAEKLMAFVPNAKGLERLLPHPIGWASAFVATSETFNQKNVNQSVKETLRGVADIARRAHEAKRKVRLYISTVFGCPYEGKISPERLGEVFRRAIDCGADEIALSDTIGVAVPSQVSAVLEAFLPLFPVERTAMHFHNTYGMALAAAHAASSMGIRKFDGTTGGTGGCPYAKGATGNVATDELAYFFHRQGSYPALKLAPLFETLDYLSRTMGVALHSHLFDIQRKGGTVYGIE